MKGSKMKKMKKRILAALLCTTMMLNTGVSAMADGGTAVSSESAHVHTEECYEKSKTDNLICTKAEAAESHVHGDSCYEVTSTPELICTQAETAGHTHGDSCMETTKNLICGKEEHTHGDGCVETEEVLTCTAEEHTHADGCYEVKTNIVCGQDEVEPHTHGEGCYTTVENKTLKCTLEEAEAHTHNDDCYAWEDKLVCTIEETKPAQKAENGNTQEPAEEQSTKETEVKEEPTEVKLQNDDETGIKVSVKSTSDVIPEDTKVVVASMEMDEEHEAALAEAVSEFEVLGYTAYDISLKDAEDEDITLGENKVEVAIDFEELIPEGINAEEVKDVVLVHITTDEEEKLTAETVGTVEITEEKATVEFEADSFSPYVVTYLSETEEVVEETVIEEPVVEDITLTYTSEDEAYTATVTAAPEVLENVTAFESVQVTDEEKITALTEQLTAKAAEMQKTSLGLENYEFKFLDAEGNEVSVNGEVKVSLSFAEERIPEAATAENVDAVDAALLKTGTDDKGEAVLEEINGLISAEAGAVKEVVYTTEAPEELILAWSGDVYRTLPNYEDDEVVITLAGTEYALQNVVGFNVTPIKEDNEETKEQYAEVAQQLEEKIAEENEAKEEEKAVVGFLAYDITLVDAEGNELEPQGGVRVSMEYKEAAAPEAVAEAEEAEVTIHHFEEDEKGEVKQIVDMVAEEAVEAEVTTTENAEVEKAEFVTEGFSVFTITWTKSKNKLIADVFYGYLTEGGFVEFDLEQIQYSEGYGAIKHITVSDSETITNLNDYILTIDGYELQNIMLDDAVNGNEARYLQRRTQTNSVYYSNNRTVDIRGVLQGEKWDDLSNPVNKKSIYFIYRLVSPYSVTANMIDLSGQRLGKKTIRLNENEIYTISNVGNAEINGKEYTYLSAYIMDGETRVDVQSIIYKDEKYYYTDDMGDEYELTSETQIYLEYAGPGRISYDAVNMSGSTLQENKTLELAYGETYQLKRLSYITVNGTRYSYSSAYIVSEGETITVSEITYSGGKYYYTNDEGNLMEIKENDELYLKYRSSNDQLTEITTVDHSSDGIVMKMFDYNLGGNPVDSNIKTNFMDIGGGWAEGKITQGRLKSRLNNNGYPETIGGTSLAPIFGGGGSTTSGSSVGKTQTVNHLFSQSTYNATGYYEFSSFENYAYIDGDGTTADFKVYEQIGSPEKSNLGSEGSRDHILYQRGNFYPYNNISNTSILSNQYNWYDEDANALSEGDYRYREPLYKINNPNYYFGMYMETTFIQPKDGKVTWKGTTSPMRYEFNGDDDLWVFIDGVLVLDLGGIHVAHRGYIDFATGDVALDKTYNGAAPVVDTNLKEIYQKLKIFPDGTPWDNSKVSEYFTGNTFANYTPHELKMYYMERGDGASDLHIKFNLPAIPKDTVTVQKEITNYTEGAYSDVDFSFNMYVKQDGQFKKVSEGTPYVHATADGKETEKVVGADGVFKLKHNEKAVFKTFDAGTIFYVEEVGISQDTYDKVDIVGSGVLNADRADIAEDQTTIRSKELEIGKDYFVLFQNRCAAFNMKHIYIDKVLTGGTAPNDKFSVKVTVAGKPYTGTYKVVTKGQDASATDKVLTAGSNGTITLKANQTAIILGYASGTDDGRTVTGVPSGTTFKVEEVKLSVDKYKEPTYEVVKDTAEVNGTANGYNGYAEGKVILSNNARVVVTNTMRTSQLTVTKKFVGPTGKVIDAPEDLSKIELVINESYNATSDEDDFSQAHTLILENKGGVFTGTLTNVKTYTDFVITSETMKDADGNAIVNASDWQMTGYTWDRFASAAVVDSKYVESNSETYYELPATGYVLVQYNGTWYLVMKYKESISTAAINKIKTVTQDVSELTLINPEEAATMFGATLTYESGGITTFQFTNAVWTNFYEGKIATTDLVISGEVTNKLDATTDITVNKEWIDNNSTAKRPASISVSLMIGESVVEDTTVNLTAEKEWKHTFTGLAKYDEDGNIIVYTAKENNVPEGYTSTVNGTTITNTLLYELPSTGGHGIYTTMLSGFALMLGAAYVWFTSRREESSNN